MVLAGFHAFPASKDSLAAIIKNSQLPDTVRIKTYRELAYHYLFDEGNVILALEATTDGNNLAATSGNYYWQAKMNALAGFILQNYTSDYERSIQSYFRALGFYDKTDKQSEVFAVYLNLGNIYYNYNQLDDAIKYYKNAEQIALKNGKEEDLATVYINLGAAYNVKKMDDVALSYYASAKVYYEKLNNELEVATIDFNMANISVNRSGKTISKQQRVNAIRVYMKVRDVFKKHDDMTSYSKAVHALGSELTQVGQLQQGLDYSFEAEKIATEMKDYTLLIAVYEAIVKGYNTSKNYIKEAEYLKKQIIVKDSLFTENKSKVIAETQIKYQTEKTETENKILQQQTKIKDLELNQKDIEIEQSLLIRYTLIIGLTLIALFAIFLFNRFKVTREQKKIIEQQKRRIEEKHQETTDSITYAKRLQQAILPSDEFIHKFMPDNFIFYKPKDIVAGDFYWMEVIDETIFVAAADCTGHGVPGALVSVVCSNALNRTVKEFGLRNTGEILDKVTDLVLETFEKSTTDVKDGMDISLLSHNLSTKQIQWSGANNPLWYFHKGEMHKIKADKQPIGKFDTRKSFTTHSIEHMENMSFYLFTDGFADQFGGPNGKKFTYKRFEEGLLAASALPMKEQEYNLEKVFLDWKGELEQIDDVTVIGIRI